MRNKLLITLFIFTFSTLCAQTESAVVICERLRTLSSGERSFLTEMTVLVASAPFETRIVAEDSYLRIENVRVSGVLGDKTTESDKFPYRRYIEEFSTNGFKAYREGGVLRTGEKVINQVDMRLTEAVTGPALLASKLALPRIGGQCWGDT